MELNYKCEHCGKKFAKESTLIVHVCEKKRRHMSRNERHVQMGLLTYQKFYDLTQNTSKSKTFEEFIASPYYTAFVKFGSFMINTAPIYPEMFIEYIVRSGVRLDHWCRDELYDQYILEMIKKEPADGAVQRSIKTMIEWADANKSTWEHYFLYTNLNRATHDIKEGLISPWLLLNTKSGKDLLRNMNDEQLAIVGPVINPQFWIKKFKTSPADTELVKEIVKEAKIP
jgi:hypothetical protein